MTSDPQQPQGGGAEVALVPIWRGPRAPGLS
jgi:hypothetical protein